MTSEGGFCGGPIIASPERLEVFTLSARDGLARGFESGERSVFAEESLIGSL